MPGERAQQAKEQDDSNSRTQRHHGADAQGAGASCATPALLETHALGAEMSGMVKHDLSVRGRAAAEASVSTAHEPGVRRQELAGVPVVAPQESESKSENESKSASKTESGPQDGSAPAADGATVKQLCVKQLCVTVSFDKASFQVCTCRAGASVRVLAAGLADVPAATLDEPSRRQCRRARGDALSLRSPARFPSARPTVKSHVGCTGRCGWERKRV
jgi:hypothetical protein